MDIVTMDIMIYDSSGSLQGDTGCNLLVLGQYNLVLIGIEWYWVNKGLLCLYVLKKKTNGDVNQPTNQPTGRIWSNLPFQKLENRKKADICIKPYIVTQLNLTFLA